MKYTYFWNGLLEWLDMPHPSDGERMVKPLLCKVSAIAKYIPDLKVEGWPNKLVMQLLPKSILSDVGLRYVKDSKHVVFHLRETGDADDLAEIMFNGHAGCVHFMPPTNQSNIKVLILMYAPNNDAFVGFIPNKQQEFVVKLRTEIREQKSTAAERQVSDNNEIMYESVPTMADED